MSDVPPIVPVATRQERRDSWILSKIRNNSWTIASAARKNPEFAEALRKWRAGEMQVKEIVSLAHQFAPLHETIGDGPLLDNNVKQGIRSRPTRQNDTGSRREGEHTTSSPIVPENRPSSPQKPARLIAEADTDTP